MDYSKGSRSGLFTKDQFKNFSARHGFTCTEKGARQAFEEDILEDLRMILKQAIVSADQNNRKGLNEQDALVAIDNMPELPKGLYQTRSKGKKGKKRSKDEEGEEEEKVAAAKKSKASKK